jgi:hypothetical protein
MVSEPNQLDHAIKERSGSMGMDQRQCPVCNARIHALLHHDYDASPEAPCQIVGYAHCGLCMSERPADQSPAEFARLNVGYTPQGIQIWCVRHDCNVQHIKLPDAKA